MEFRIITLTDSVKPLKNLESPTLRALRTQGRSFAGAYGFAFVYRFILCHPAPLRAAFLRDEPDAKHG
jgi:hypothetical protein